MSDRLTCQKCLKTFTDITKLKRHMERKNPCDYNKDTMCKYCHKIFSRSDVRDRHEKKNCILNMDALIERKKENEETSIVEFLTKIKKDEDLPTIIINDALQYNSGNIHIEQENIGQQNIQNIGQQNVQTIQQFFILKYGDENMQHITDEYLRNLYDETRMYNAIPKLIKDIHLNEQYPENMNFMMLNQHKQTMKYKAYADEWKEVTTNQVTTELIDDKHNMLEEFYQKNKSTLKKQQIKNYKDLRTNLEINKDYHKYLKKTILEYFLKSKQFMETIVNMDSVHLTNVENMKHALKGYKSALFAIEKIMETQYNTQSNSLDINDQEILDFIHKELQ
jgi:hypothetical protein